MRMRRTTPQGRRTLMLDVEQLTRELIAERDRRLQQLTQEHEARVAQVERSFQDALTALQLCTESLAAAPIPAASSSLSNGARRTRKVVDVPSPGETYGRERRARRGLT